MYKLMIAEDEFLEKKVLNLIVNKSFTNIEVVKDASNGEEAIKAARLFRPHLIIMDIKMPIKNGIDAQKEIISFLPNVKTIILSAYDEFTYAQQALKFQAIDYLLKPSKPYEIVESIKHGLKLIENTTSAYENINNTPTLKDYKDDIINNSLSYISNNFNKNITLDSVASCVHLAPQYFSKYFKKNIGINFIEYLSKYRIEAAKKLLLTTNYSIGLISLNVGYVDAAYFSKVFMKLEGVTPHKYRVDNR